MHLQKQWLLLIYIILIVGSNLINHRQFSSYATCKLKTCNLLGKKWRMKEPRNAAFPRNVFHF